MVELRRKDDGSQGKTSRGELGWESGRAIDRGDVEGLGEREVLDGVVVKCGFYPNLGRNCLSFIPGDFNK